MEEVIKKLKEVVTLKNTYCNGDCSKCILSTIIKEIWYDNGYEDIDICDVLEYIEKNNIK